MKRANNNFIDVDSGGNVATVEKFLKKSRAYHLDAEVVWSALCYREACPDWTVEAVMEEACRDWDVL